MSNPSRIFLCAVSAFLSGIFIASFDLGGAWILRALIILAVLSVLVYALLKQKKFLLHLARSDMKPKDSYHPSDDATLYPVIFAAIALIFLTLGVWRYEKSEHFSYKQDLFLQERAEISGIIVGEPKIKNAQEIILETRMINGHKIERRFLILLFLRPYPRYELGDWIAAKGKFEIPQNYGDFDYRAYLEKDGIYGIARYPAVRKITGADVPFWLGIKKPLVNLKNSLVANIKSIFPEPHAAYLAGLLVGERSGLPDDVYEKFKRTGVAHLVALSGFNVAIIISALFWFLRVLAVSRAAANLLAVVSIIAFVLMVGGEPSIVRAAVMGVIALMASQSFRMYDAKRALIAAAAIMIFFNPKLLRFDAGFQLSFAATAGIIFLQPLVAERMGFIKFDFWRNVLAATLAAEIAVTPLLMFYFGGVSLIAPLVNVLVVPVVAYAMLFGFMASVLAFISVKLAFWAFVPAWILLEYNLSAISWFAAFDFAYLETSHYSIFSMFLSAVIFIFIARILHRTHL